GDPAADAVDRPGARLLYGPDLDHDADDPALQPDRRPAGVRSPVVCGPDAREPGSGADHATLRPAALRDEGRRARGHHDGRRLPGRRPVHPVQPDPDGDLDRLPDPGHLAAGADVLRARALFIT